MPTQEKTPVSQTGASTKEQSNIDILPEADEKRSIKAAISAKCLASESAPVGFTPLFNIKSEPVEWLIPDVIPLGMYTTAGGESGIGKSNFFGGYIPALVTKKGATFNGQPIPWGRVIIWSPEESLEHSVAPRLRAFGANEGLVHFINSKVWAGEGERQLFNFTEHLAKLEISIRERNTENCPYRLLVIDPITSGFYGDMNQANNVRNYLEPLKEMAEGLNIAIVGVTHFTKGSGMASSPQDRLLGSQAWSAVSRMTLGLFRDKQTDNRRLVILKTNITNDRVGYDFSYQFEQNEEGIAVPRIEFISQVHGDNKSLIDELSNDGTSELEQAKSFLRGILHDAPLPSEQVKAEAAGACYAWRTIERAAKEMKEEGSLEIKKDMGRNGKWRWYLSKQDRQDRQDRQENM